MAVPISVKLDSLIQESEILKFKFEDVIQAKNIEASFKGLFFELSPRELQDLPDFSTFDRKIQLFRLVTDCISEVNDNIFGVIETGEHVNRYLNGVLIKIEDVHKKICCFFLGNLSENDKNDSLDNEKMASIFEHLSYLRRINSPKDPNFQPGPPMEQMLIGKNIHCGTLILHMYLTMNYVSMCNHIEVQYERLRRHVTKQVEKHNPTIIKIEDLQGDINKNIPETPLKGLFKDVNVYDKIIKLMRDKGLIINTQEVLIWKGFKANRKIDIVAFCEVLFNKNLLKNRIDNYEFMHPILNETFLDFKISKKSYSNSNSFKIQNQFNELLSSF